MGSFLHGTSLHRNNSSITITSFRPVPVQLVYQTYLNKYLLISAQSVRKMKPKRYFNVDIGFVMIAYFLDWARQPTEITSQIETSTLRLCHVRHATHQSVNLIYYWYLGSFISSTQIKPNLGLSAMPAVNLIQFNLNAIIYACNAEYQTFDDRVVAPNAVNKHL